ncbi:MAG: S41 family peptidase, partial [Chloroflexi bacterium]|nr:S41 family peptidase [Chloroflexota bacterium]
MSTQPARTFLSQIFTIAAIIVAAAILSCGFGASGPSDIPSTSPVAPLPEGVPEDFHELWEVWSLLQDQYIDPERLNTADMPRGAIAGLLRALGDPYTAFNEPDAYQRQLDSLDGTFEGIGAIVGVRDERIVIVSPIRGGPAERAGLRAGDEVLAVDDVSVSGLTLSQVVARVRGPLGTTVEMLIRREGVSLPAPIVIVREAISVPTVEVELVRDGVAWIRLSGFAKQTDEDLLGQLRALDLSETRIILDLRNNPGGLVDTAIGVATEFLADDAIVFLERDRSGTETPRYARGNAVAAQVPMVVLVNRGTASASEIVAGALQTNQRAVLIGETTFGKGSVTALRTLSTGSGLTVTSARWLTPDGQLIEALGLTPDIDAVDDPTTAESDEALERAIEEVLKGAGV